MPWTVLTYSLPSTPRSSPRVALWRRLRRLGAVSPTGGVHILPAEEECIEALQWLAQEIRQAQGEALVMRVEQFDGLTDAQLIERFQQARAEEYGEIETQLVALEQAANTLTDEERANFQDSLDKLRRRHADIKRVDYFSSPTGERIAARLAALQQSLVANQRTVVDVPTAAVAEYQNKRWVTRPRPHVDRLACAWLIRRFINPNAVIRYALEPEPGEISFDMSNAHFGHQGQFCTFETMVRAFQLVEPGLQTMAEIVHEIDLRDGQYTHPELAGVDAILKGWLIAAFSDAELEAHGLALFEGLYTMFSKKGG
ncbi:MAG: chromate resistance protein [Anaerolineales bacterium]|nr:chromate resistance protein [Anaerolineales bacterium]